MNNSQFSSFVIVFSLQNMIIWITLQSLCWIQKANAGWSFPVSDTDECLSKPCMNGGTCLNQSNSFFCLCAAGHKGPRCEEETEKVGKAEDKTAVTIMSLSVVVLFLALLLAVGLAVARRLHVDDSDGSEAGSQELRYVQSRNILSYHSDHDAAHAENNMEHSVDSIFPEHSSGSTCMLFIKYLFQSVASPARLRTEFASLAHGMKHRTSVGSLQRNRSKNSLEELAAYDKNRVVLRRGSVDKSNDYINASYIQGFAGDLYIATQGPSVKTASDFWLMIWQENIKQIIMLNNLKESSKVTCLQYWPEVNRTTLYGSVGVQTRTEDKWAHFTIRTLILNRTKEMRVNRQVEQYHYTSCSEDGMPEALSLMEFWFYVNAHSTYLAPTLIHCDDGVGRTGIYLAMDIIIKLTALNQEVAVNDIVNELRDQRSSMVKSLEQYTFLYELLLEGCSSYYAKLTREQLDIICTTNMDVTVPHNRIDKEFQMLKNMLMLTQSSFTIAQQAENLVKIRDINVLPDDKQKTNPAWGRDWFFINAVFMSSLQVKNGLLLTQLPLRNTLVDFWRLVNSCNVKTIVSLGAEDDPTNVQNYCQYWPQKSGENLYAGVYTVTFQNSTSLGKHLMSYGMNFTSKYTKQSPSQLVTVFHYTDWATELPGGVQDIINVLQKLKSTTKDDSSPIVVQCLDGATRSGLFCVLYNVMSRMYKDKVVDIYSAVRAVHIVRPQAVTTEVQYRFCYKVAREFKRIRFNLYART